MGERKVLNKYFPPDFDPSLVPRGKRPKNNQMEVRMMLPFSIQCETCGEYMYRGKKFNSRKEDVIDDDYMGIRKFRFYIRCVTCSAEITFKTDPKNGDYTAEKGCMRNFEPWREKEEEKEEALKEREQEEKGDSMKSLENRTLDSKREMDILDALDEIKAINQRHEKVDTAALLNAPRVQEIERKQQEEKEDLLAAKAAFSMEARKRKLEALKQSHKGEKVALTVSSTGLKQKSREEPLKTAPLAIKVQPKGESKKGKKKKQRKIKKEKEQPKPVISSLVAAYSCSSSDE